MENEITFWFAEEKTFTSAVTQNALKLILSDDEITQNNRFSSKPDKLNHLVSRAMIRTGLSSLSPQRPLSSWQFGRGVYGKPYVKNIDEMIEFSLSHTRGIVVCAFSRCGRIGIDIEPADRQVDWLSMQRHCLSAIEVEQLMAQPEEKRKHLFLTFWVLKESYLKALGRGITPHMNSISFILDDCASTARLMDNDEYTFTYGYFSDRYVFSCCTGIDQKNEFRQGIIFNKFDPWIERTAPESNVWGQVS